MFILYKIKSTIYFLKTYFCYDQTKKVILCFKTAMKPEVGIIAKIWHTFYNILYYGVNMQKSVFERFTLIII